MGKHESDELRQVQLASGDISDELVPSKKGSGLYEKRAYVRTELVFKKGYYFLYLYTETERIQIVALRTSLPRKWGNVDRALEFIKKHVGIQTVIYLLYP